MGETIKLAIVLFVVVFCLVWFVYMRMDDNKKVNKLPPGYVIFTNGKRFMYRRENRTSSFHHRNYRKAVLGAWEDFEGWQEWEREKEEEKNWKPVVR